MSSPSSPFSDALPEFQHPFTHDQVEGAFARFSREAVLVRLRDGGVAEVQERPGFQSRNACAVELLKRCAARHRLPDCSLLVFTGDRRRPEEPQDDFIATFCRSEGETNPLWPNFNFIHHRECGIGDYFGETLPRLTALAEAHPWAGRRDQAFFAGADTNPVRRKLVRACIGHPRCDLRLVAWGDPARAPVPLEDHVGWRWLLNINGWSYSGRLLHLIPLGGAVLQMADSRPSQRFSEFFTPAALKAGAYATIGYRRWEPGWLIRRRLVAALDRLDGERLAAEGRRWWQTTVTEAAVLAYLAELVRRWAGACR